MFRAITSRVLVVLSLALLSRVSLGVDEPKPARVERVPMRDGVELAMDIYLPRAPDSTGKDADEKRWPALLVRTPYGRTRYNREFGRLATKGWVVAIQDTRGRFDSGGKAMGFLTDAWGEQQDGKDTVEWLARREYCNGKVGTLGASAMGIAQLLLAPTQPEGLGAQYILVGAPSLYEHSCYPGGAFRKKLVEDWLRGHAHPEALEITRAHPLYDEHWHGVDAVRRARDVRVPAIHYGGWYDVFCEGTVAAFRAWQRNGEEGAKNRQVLVMGPWTHGGPGETKLGEFTLPEPARSVPFDISAERWFAHHLKGQANGVDELPAVMYYVMGPIDGGGGPGNVWRTADSWPPKSRSRTYHLASDGALETSPTEAGKLTFTYDPDNPVPTRGGRNLYLPSGPFDQREIEARDDVLVFTTKPLAEDTEITGSVQARIAIITDAPDTDVSVRLCDVYPDGRSILIADASARLLASTRGEEIEPGKVYRVEVDLGPTSIVIPKGHRIRVAVTSSNFPRFEANPNNGKLRYTPEPRRVARNTILFGGEEGSRIRLPVIHYASDEQVRETIALIRDFAKALEGGASSALIYERFVHSQTKTKYSLSRFESGLESLRSFAGDFCKRVLEAHADDGIAKGALTFKRVRDVPDVEIRVALVELERKRQRGRRLKRTPIEPFLHAIDLVAEEDGTLRIQEFD